MPSYSGVWTLTAQYQAIGGQNWPMAPGAPTSVSATGGDASATVSFTAPTFVGIPPPITGYLATSTPGGLTATGASSPLTVTGLSNGTAYTFGVQATNAVGYGPAGTSGSVTPAAPRGIFFGGSGASTYNTIQYITISTTGNATDFGDLDLICYGAGACADATRAICFANAAYENNVIQYVTIASAGNATDFGDALFPTGYLAGCSNSTRGIMFGGTNGNAGSAIVNVIQYITIASIGNSTDFGDLSLIKYQSAACASSTRAVSAGGTDYGGVRQVGMQYVTIASTGNSTSFGSLGTGTYNFSGISSATRGVFAGGDTAAATYSNVIQYITIASTGNTTDFGDLNQGSQQGCGCSSSVRGVFGIGLDSSNRNVLEYITIASTGNATDFGDLIFAASLVSATSNAHGGL
jgi:hypothetical protein